MSGMRPNGRGASQNWRGENPYLKVKDCDVCYHSIREQDFKRHQMIELISEFASGCRDFVEFGSRLKDELLLQDDHVAEIEKYHERQKEKEIADYHRRRKDHNHSDDDYACQEYGLCEFDPRNEAKYLPPEDEKEKAPIIARKILENLKEGEKYFAKCEFDLDPNGNNDLIVTLIPLSKTIQFESGHRDVFDP